MAGRGQEEEDLGGRGLVFRWVLRVLSPIFCNLRTEEDIEEVIILFKVESCIKLHQSAKKKKEKSMLSLAKKLKKQNLFL